MLPPLEISLLGELKISLNDQPIDGFESDKVRALFAFLVVENDRKHRREKLAGLLWPEMPEKPARHNLSQAFYNLRKTLFDSDDTPGSAKDSYFTATSNEICFCAGERAWLDVTAFRAGLNGCARHAPNPLSACDDCLHQQGEALALYRGELMAGFSVSDSPAFEEWLIVERENLHRQALERLDVLATTCRQRGDLSQALTYAFRATTLDPLLESTRREVMRSLWLAGHRSEALAHYDEFCDLLHKELGVEPDEETRRLARQIQADETIESSPLEVPGNLPFALMPFIGRLDQIHQVKSIATSHELRLLSIVGPGGTGKTRLALETARSLTGCFADGIHFVPCSPIEGPEGLAPALAKILGLLPDPNRSAREQLIDYLRQKELLFILDSFERLVPATPLVLDLLRAAPGLTILATTRARLNVQEEQLFPLKGLDYGTPDPDADGEIPEAVQLFLTGARRTRPAFELTAENQAAISEICRLVEGMPLAILLAGAWVELMKPEEILAEIEKSYDFLQADWLDVPRRQRSLRATFDYSWRLLSDEEKRLFPRLSVFRGGFTREAAERITQISLSQLRGLIGKSLLWRVPGGRYDLHDIVREYGAEKLRGADDEAEIQARHCAWYLRGLAQRESGLKSGCQEENLNEIDVEFNNIQAAWNTAVTQQKITLLEESVSSLGLYCELRVRYQEGLQACQKAARMLGAIKPSAEHLRAKIRVQSWQARFLRLLGNSEQVLSMTREAIELLDYSDVESEASLSDRAFLLLEMGNQTQHTDRENADGWFQQSLNLYRAIEDDWGAAFALAGLAEVAMQTGRFEESINHFEQSLVRFHNSGDRRGMAFALTGLGHSLFRVGRLGEGEEKIRTMIDIFEELGDKARSSTGLLHLARAYFWQGRFSEIVEIGRKMLPIAKDIGFQYEATFMLMLTGLSALMLGQYRESMGFVEEMKQLPQGQEYPRLYCIIEFCQGSTALVSHDYSSSQTSYQKFIDKMGSIGQRDEQAAGIAWLACTKLQTGEFRRAKELLCEVLDTAVELEATWAASWGFPVVALYLARQEQLEEALAVQVLTKRLPIPANSIWMADVAMNETEALVATLPDEVAAGARKRAETAELFAFTAELLEFMKTVEQVIQD